MHKNSKIIIQGAGNVEKCEQIADVDPYVVSKNLGIYANSVRSYGRHKALNVYISAPPSQPILKCILEYFISLSRNSPIDLSLEMNFSERFKANWN